MNANSSTTNKWLATAITILEKAGIATARLDCLVLLEDATGKDRSWLLAHSDFSFQGQTLETVDKWIERRAGHEPLAYIRGKSEFYGREFAVNTHTLEPRPETEMMITLLKQLVEDRRWKMEDGSLIDIGTGSGCIAITAKLELPELEVVATDIDEKCIETAEQNAQKLGADITFYKGNLLAPLPNSIFQIPSSKFAILANLPYVPDSYKINKAAQFEPSHALFGGVDGLDLYRELFAQLKTQNSKLKAQYVLTESLPFQHHTLATIARNHGYTLEKTEDFIQVFAA